jgi:nicotinate dehydrogenase subunit A
VTTLEGLCADGTLDPVQWAFIDCAAAQCGYCLNGMIMTAWALLDANPDPSDAEIREALRFNLCRCGAHVEILAAVRLAASPVRA